MQALRVEHRVHEEVPALEDDDVPRVGLGHFGRPAPRVVSVLAAEEAAADLGAEDAVPGVLEEQRAVPAHPDLHRSERQHVAPDVPLQLA